MSVQSISVLLFITASFGKDMCGSLIAQLVGRLSGNPGVPTLQQISVQVLYQIASREELLSFHLHFHAIILYCDATSTWRFAHYFYAIYLHQFAILYKVIQKLCISNCKIL